MTHLTSQRIWDSKPFWCQPWSILLTGIFLILTSWFLFSNVILSIIVFIGVFLWWILFLYIAPLAYRNESIQEIEKLTK